jgi:hypothetical protein
MRIGDTDLVGIAIREHDQAPPRPVYVNGPEAAQVALQFVQTNAVEPAQHIERGAALSSFNRWLASCSFKPRDRDLPRSINSRVAEP